LARRRALEAAADSARRRAVAARVERERLAEVRRQKDAAFIRDRDATASTLKGSIGTIVSPNSGGGLKGSSKIETGLRELRGTELDAHDAPQGAWRQLHCAAALSGYAFAAVTKATPDYQESTFLLAQAGNALDGQALRVECPATPPFPEQALAVDMAQVKEAQKQNLSRAAVIIERMKERDVPPATPTSRVEPAMESPSDRIRRAQQELNATNSAKITGRTREDIAQREADRIALARVIVANSRLERGELVSVTVAPAPVTPKRRTSRPPANQ